MEDLHTTVVDAIADQLGLLPACEMVQALRSALVHAWEERHGWNTAKGVTLYADGLRGLKSFTVTIAGCERFDGEAPYTWVLEAPDVTAAIDAAMLYHSVTQEEDVKDLELDPLGTFEGEPSPDCGYSWNDLRGSEI